MAGSESGGSREVILTPKYLVDFHGKKCKEHHRLGTVYPFIDFNRFCAIVRDKYGSGDNNEEVSAEIEKSLEHHLDLIGKKEGLLPDEAQSRTLDEIEKLASPQAGTGGTSAGTGTAAGPATGSPAGDPDWSLVEHLTEFSVNSLYMSTGLTEDTIPRESLGNLLKQIALGTKSGRIIPDPDSNDVTLSVPESDAGDISAFIGKIGAKGYDNIDLEDVPYNFRDNVLASGLFPGLAAPAGDAGATPPQTPEPAAPASADDASGLERDVGDFPARMITKTDDTKVPGYLWDEAPDVIKARVMKKQGDVDEAWLESEIGRTLTSGLTYGMIKVKGATSGEQQYAMPVVTVERIVDVLCKALEPEQVFAGVSQQPVPFLSAADELVAQEPEQEFLEMDEIINFIVSRYLKVEEIDAADESSRQEDKKGKTKPKGKKGLADGEADINRILKDFGKGGAPKTIRRRLLENDEINAMLSKYNVARKVEGSVKMIDATAATMACEKACQNDGFVDVPFITPENAEMVFMSLTNSKYYDLSKLPKGPVRSMKKTQGIPAEIKKSARRLFFDSLVRNNVYINSEVALEFMDAVDKYIRGDSPRVSPTPWLQAEIDNAKKRGDEKGKETGSARRAKDIADTAAMHVAAKPKRRGLLGRLYDAVFGGRKAKPAAKQAPKPAGRSVKDPGAAAEKAVRKGEGLDRLVEAESGAWGRAPAGAREKVSFVSRKDAYGLPEGYVSSLAGLFGALALKYLDADTGKCEDPSVLKRKFEKLTLLPAAHAFEDDKGEVHIGFNVDATKKLYDMFLGEDKQKILTGEDSRRRPVEDIAKSLKEDSEIGISTPYDKARLESIAQRYAEAVSPLQFIGASGQENVAVSGADGRTLAHAVIGRTVKKVFLGEWAPAEGKEKKPLGVFRKKEHELGVSLVTLEVAHAYGYCEDIDLGKKAEIRENVDRILGDEKARIEMGIRFVNGVYRVDSHRKGEVFDNIKAKVAKALEGAEKPEETGVPAAYAGPIREEELENLVNKDFGHYGETPTSAAIQISEIRAIVRDRDLAKSAGYVDGPGLYAALKGSATLVDKKEEIKIIHREVKDVKEKGRKAEEALVKFAGDPLNRQNIEELADNLQGQYNNPISSDPKDPNENKRAKFDKEYQDDLRKLRDAENLSAFDVFRLFMAREGRQLEILNSRIISLGTKAVLSDELKLYYDKAQTALDAAMEENSQYEDTIEQLKGEKEKAEIRAESERLKSVFLGTELKESKTKLKEYRRRETVLIGALGRTRSKLSTRRWLAAAGLLAAVAGWFYGKPAYDSYTADVEAASAEFRDSASNLKESVGEVIKGYDDAIRILREGAEPEPVSHPEPAPVPGPGEHGTAKGGSPVAARYSR